MKGAAPRQILETNGSIPGVTVGSLSYCDGGLRCAGGGPVGASRENPENPPLEPCSWFAYTPLKVSTLFFCLMHREGLQ